MSRWLFILVIATLWALCSKGQDTPVHSLLNVADSLREASVYDSAMVYYQKSLQFANESDDKKLTIQTLNGLGLALIDLSKYDEAESKLKEAIALGAKHLDSMDPVLGESHSRLGYCYSKHRKIDQAIEQYNISLEIFMVNFGEINEHTSQVYSRLGAAYYLLGNNSDKSIELLLRSLSIYQQLTEQYPLEVARVYNDLANVYQDEHEFEKALDYHFRSLATKKRILGNMHPEIGISSYNLGRVNYSMGDYDKAIEYFNQTLAVDLHTFGDNHLWVGEDHYSIADCYMAYGDYELALHHAQRSADILRKSFGSKHSRYATPLLTIGQAYLNLEQPEEALPYFREALQIFTQTKDVNRDILAGKASSNALIGVALFKLGQYQVAIDHLNLSINSGLTTMHDQANFEAESHRNIGFCYTELGNYHSALESFNRSLAILTKEFGSYHPKIAETYRSMGETYLANNQVESALKHYQTALGSLVPGLDEDYLVNPTLEELSTLPTTLEILGQKAWAFRIRYQNENNPDYLDHAHETFQLAVNLIDTLRIGFLEQGSKQSLLNNHLKIYERSLAVAQELYEVHGDKSYLASAFEVMEKSKSFMLLSTIRESEAKQFANIPDALIEQERALKSTLAFYETQGRTENDQKNQSQWRNKAYNTRKSYDSLLHAISETYPEYHGLKYNTKVATLESVQTQLKPDEVLMLYFMGTDELFALAIEANEQLLYSHPVTEDFHQQIKLVRKSLNDKLPFSNEVAKASHELYQQLIGPSADMIQHKNVTVVPDGALNYFPFEILTSAYNGTETNFMDLEYLIFNHSFNYAFSSTSLLATRERESSTKQFDYLAFAPAFNERGGLADANPSPLTNETVRGNLSELKGTKRETGIIARYFSGQLFQDAAATESQFKLAAPQSDIIHLATHAIVDDQDPLNSRLLFTISEDSINDGDLYVWELYNMQLDAQMTVLSACNTGFGKLERGEGVMSLGRAFAYAGCPSIIMSLWPAQDEATADIMELFYEGIADGLPKDHALAAAKRAYLKRADDLFSHPFYWAGFITQGDPKPVGLSENWGIRSVVMISLAALLLLLLFITIRSRVFQSKT